MRRWVIVGHWEGPQSGLFSGRNAIATDVIEAEDEDAAAAAAIKRMNVLSLRHGVSFEVLPVNDSGPRYRAKYANPGTGREHCFEGMPSDLRVEKDITAVLA